MKLVSVIVPTYNRGKEVIDTLDSVLEQTYPNIEVIVVDDGSIDNTATVVKKYITDHANSNIPIYYYWQENGGTSAAKNFGFSKSKGFYILFFDSDDTLLPHRIEKQVTAMEQEVANTCAAGFYRYKNGELNKIELHYTYPNMTYINQILMKWVTGKGLMASSQSWLFTRERIDAVGGYDEFLRNYEDIDICFRLHLLKDTNMVIVNEPLSIFNDDDRPDRLMKSRLKDNEKGAYYSDILTKKMLTNQQVLEDETTFINSLVFYVNIYIIRFAPYKGFKWTIKQWHFLTKLPLKMY
jgi:glycosyltransferase involved in cell wall biosynthesis